MSSTLATAAYERYTASRMYNGPAPGSGEDGAASIVVVGEDKGTPPA